MSDATPEYEKNLDYGDESRVSQAEDHAEHRSSIYDSRDIEDENFEDPGEDEWNMNFLTEDNELLG